MLISTKAFRCHMIFVSEQSLRHWDTSTLRFVAQANLFLFIGVDCRQVLTAMLRF